MMSAGSALVFKAPWIIIFPGLAVAITVVAINLYGDALIAALDIRARLRRAHERASGDRPVSVAIGRCACWTGFPDGRPRPDPGAGGRKRLGQVADGDGGDGPAAADRRAGDGGRGALSTGRTWAR
jgi:hypothetical protein